MNIGILGSGAVGQSLGTALARQGHEVVLGTRTPEELERPRGHGAASLAVWRQRAGASARTGTFPETAAHGHVILNATNGAGSLDALRAAGAPNLRGKVLIDISNPLDFSHGMPPTLFVANDDSLAERIQAAFPETRVVKTLNTTNALVMTDPARVGGGDHTLFVSGNDPEAKRQVMDWLREWFGWRDIIDLGDITTARGAEMLLPLWLRLMGALGTPMFNFKIVR